MKVLYTIVSILVFCCGVFLKFGRAQRIINKNSAVSAYEESGDQSFGNLNELFYSDTQETPTVTPGFDHGSGVQTNPFVQ